MTNPTSNFGWQMPTSTDLVTDLPADFEVFGQAVDTSLADLKGGTSGQILSKASNTDMDFTWITNDVGDITGVTAGTGITGGGTSGAVTVSLDQANFGGGQNAAGKNEVLNSNFSCWQRGTSFAGTGAAGTYSADRWKYYNNGTSLTVSRQATGDTTNLPFIQYCARVARNNAATNTNSNYLEQSFESANSIPFAGKTVTLSFYARKGANYSTASSNLYAELRTGTGTDQDWLTGYTGDTAAISQAAVLTTTWQRFSYSATLSASMTEMAVVFASVPVGTAGAADYFEVTGVQVEAASTASPYTPNTSTRQAELAACQRYYFRTGGSQIIGSGYVSSTTTFEVNFQLPVTMRTAATFAGATGTSFYYAGIAATNLGFNSVTQFFNSTNQSAQARFTGTALVAGQAGYVQTNNASSYLEASAEL